MCFRCDYCENYFDKSECNECKANDRLLICIECFEIEKEKLEEVAQIARSVYKAK